MQIIYQTVKPFDQLLKKQKMKPGEKYRPMYFVVEQPVDEGLLLYHTMTKALLLLTPEEAEVYKTHPADLSELIELWYLVPESHDDRLLSRQIRDVAKMLEKKSTAITSYTILTTTDCNARCFYCYEMGRPRVPMSRDTAIKTAEYIIKHCCGEKVNLTWFGGEPLYNRPVISLICQRLKDAKVDYHSNMITNGFLFDDDSVKEAKKLWNLDWVQITLDGTEKIYNRSKAFIYKDVNAYQHVIRNIHRLQDAGITVRIRLNIDMHNADNLMELTNELHNEFTDPKGISIYMHTLFETVKGSTAMRNCQKRDTVFKKIQEIDTQLIEYGFFKPKQLDRHIKTNRCMADSDKCVVIVPNGYIGKCEHFTEDHFIGHIDKEGLDTNKQEEFKACNDEIDACATCFYYPNCVWLKICEDVPYCYQEERDNYLHNIHQRLLKAYKKYKNKEQDEIQD